MTHNYWHKHKEHIVEVSDIAEGTPETHNSINSKSPDTRGLYIESPILVEDITNFGKEEECQKKEKKKRRIESQKEIQSGNKKKI